MNLCDMNEPMRYEKSKTVKFECVFTELSLFEYPIILQKKFAKRDWKQICGRNVILETYSCGNQQHTIRQ